MWRSPDIGLRAVEVSNCELKVLRLSENCNAAINLLLDHIGTLEVLYIEAADRRSAEKFIATNALHKEKWVS